MIDFHTHILPGMDDGSRDINMTKKMIRTELEQGVDRIVLTPHFYAQQDDPDRFIFKRRNSYMELIKCLNSLESNVFPQFRLGAEVLYFPGIGHSGCIQKLCIDNSNVLLLEMPFEQWTNAVFKDVCELVEKQQLQVVLAHVERFYQFQRDKAVWKDVLELPVIPQINTGSLLNWSSRLFDYKFIKAGHKIILGTDAHNDTTRVVNMNEGRDKLRKRFGECLLSEIDETGMNIWESIEKYGRYEKDA